MIRNFPLHVSQYRLKGLVAEVSSLNTYRRALQSVTPALKEQVLRLEKSLGAYTARLDELLLNALDLCERNNPIGEPELKRSQDSAQFLSALCYGTMLRIEEQKISEADDQSTLVHSALCLMEACASQKDQKFFTNTIFKKSAKLEELRSRYFSKEVLICDLEQKPRVQCGQLSEYLLANPQMELLLPEDIDTLCNHSDDENRKEEPVAASASSHPSSDNHDNMLSLDSEDSGSGALSLKACLHQLNSDISQMLTLFDKQTANQAQASKEDKGDKQKEPASVQGESVNEQALVDGKIQELYTLLERTNFAALKSLQDHLDDIKEKMVQITAREVAETRTTANAGEDSDDIDEWTAPEFLESIISYLTKDAAPDTLLSQLLESLQTISPSNITVKDAASIKNVKGVIDRLNKLTAQKEHLNSIISSLNKSLHTVTSAPSSIFGTGDGKEYMDLFTSAVGDYQELVIRLSSAANAVQITIDGLQKCLIENCAHFIMNISSGARFPSKTSARGAVSTPGIAHQGELKENLSNKIKAIRNQLNIVSQQVVTWDTSAKTRISAHDKTQSRLNSGQTIAKYATSIMDHRQASRQLLKDIQKEIDEIVEAETLYNKQAHELYLEQLKLSATIKALPCSDSNREALASLMNHKRCKKCRTFDWTMCRIEDGFLYCANCMQNETGKWVRVLMG